MKSREFPEISPADEFRIVMAGQINILRRVRECARRAGATLMLETIKGDDYMSIKKVKECAKEVTDSLVIARDDGAKEELENLRDWIRIKGLPSDKGELEIVMKFIKYIEDRLKELK